jgi:DNA repair photolyase
MSEDRSPIRGRGAASNPPNRFERIHYEPDPDASDPEAPGPVTQLFKDASRSIIAYNDSPDVGFTASVNPYRGCGHGCAYCYARPTHEYLGFSAGLDFETKIMVKEDAPELLRRELSSSRWRPQPLAFSGVTDPYQPVERQLRLTRRCLEVVAEFRNPVGIVTKSKLVTRDLDLLTELARHQAAAVFLSVTTLDGKLARALEPRASPPAARLAAIEAVAKAGVPVGVLVAPVIPGLTDHELPAILAAAAHAGARFAGYVTLRLPYAAGPLFEEWLTLHAPGSKDKVLGRIRSLRGGKLNDARFGSRMRGEGTFAELIEDLFRLGCRQAGIGGRGPSLSTAAFRRPGGTQLLLFE